MAKQSNNDNGISDSLANEARSVGIEPSGYADSKQLQERIEHVKAEREAVSKGQPDLEKEAADERKAAEDGVMSTANTPSNNS